VAGGIDVTFHEPLGVVGIIVPWNFPMAIAGWGFAPALAAGNTVVLKPAELTPLSALRIGELAVEAGIPPDVFQVISGKGSVVGWRFVTHPAVRKVCFTGSTEVGKGIMAGCAEQVKRVTLELGGKSANVVFADADIELAAARAPYGVFDNAGQDCCARSRILVERSAYDQFMALLEPAVRGVVVGDPLDERTEMGPLISPSHLEEVSSFVPDDAPVAFRGEAPAGPATGSRQRCWRRSNAPHERSPRRSSDRWWSSSPSRTKPRPLPSPTTASTGCPARSGPKTSVGRSAWRVPSTRGTSRSTRTRRCGIGPLRGFKQSGIGRELGPDALGAFSDVKNVFISTEE